MPASKTRKTATSQKQPKSDPAVSYNEWKFFEGQFYKGLKIGRTLTWKYDKGVWKDRKITPDMFEINYAVTKRRAGKAPKGSGVPVGTEYHWYILGHQIVKKLNADDYTTSLSGMKFKVAYKKAETEKWSATPKTQRKRMITFLEEMLDDLKKQAREEEKKLAAKKDKKKTSPSKASNNKTKKTKSKQGVNSQTSKARARTSASS